MSGFRSFILAVSIAAGLIAGIDGGQIENETLSIEMFPYTVSLQLHDLHSCTGSIISSKFVLTAASCALLPAEKYSIRTGSQATMTGGSTHRIERIILHQDYAFFGLDLNDIALLEVKEPFQFDNTRAKIPLAEEETPPGTLATAVGWGKSNEAADESPVEFQAPSVSIIDKAKCKNRVEDTKLKMENLICAGFAGKDFFNGVSGCPLVHNGLQIGIFSWGPLTEHAERPDVYTDVAKYIPWIKKYVPDL